MTVMTYQHTPSILPTAPIYGHPYSTYADDTTIIWDDIKERIFIDIDDKKKYKFVEEHPHGFLFEHIGELEESELLMWKIAPEAGLFQLMFKHGDRVLIDQQIHEVSKIDRTPKYNGFVFTKVMFCTYTT